MAQAHEDFLSEGSAAAVRPLVAESWRRSADRGVDPGAGAAPVVLTDDELDAARSTTEWATALPLIRTLLGDPAVDAGHVVALADAGGRLLWVDGDRSARRLADRMGFTEGALWSEEAAGTNAPGTALAIDRPVQIRTHEHFVGVVQQWSCTAVPIHDPATGDTIGVLDVTGQEQVASPLALAMVRATAVAVEQMLAAQGGDRSSMGARLETLGRDRALLRHRGRTVRLSSRHSELVVLLALTPAGLSGEALAAQLREHEISPVTLRAELARLRRLLGSDVVLSRPYRLAVDVTTDFGEVISAIDRGDVLRAIQQYQGPVLPGSDSPAIRELRSELRTRMRRAALVGSDADLLLAFARTEDGRDDVEVLRTALHLLPAGSPKRLGVTARLEQAHSRLAVPAPRRPPVRPPATSLQPPRS